MVTDLNNTLGRLAWQHNPPPVILGEERQIPPRTPPTHGPDINNEPEGR